MRVLRNRIAKNKLVGFLVIVSFVLLLPIILPVALIQDRIRTRRIQRIVCDIICVSCGARLGMEALRIGHERWAAIVSNLHEQYPGMRFRSASSWQSLRTGRSIQPNTHTVAAKARRVTTWLQSEFSLNGPNASA